MSSEVYRRALFEGKGYIPSIPVIQAYIEQAWARGFDEEGAKQLGFSLSGGKKWIGKSGLFVLAHCLATHPNDAHFSSSLPGSMECAALLRSFGINCTVVDFFRATGADGTHPELLKWVWDYFSSFYSPPSPRCPDSITSPTLDALLLLPSSPAPLPNVHSASSFASILKRPEHKRLLSNTAKSLEAQQKSHKASRSPSPTFSPLLYSPTFVPPIFFQHEGHSRTIVGIEKRKNGTLHLLILGTLIVPIAIQKVGQFTPHHRPSPHRPESDSSTGEQTTTHFSTFSQRPQTSSVPAGCCRSCSCMPSHDLRGDAKQ